MLSSSLSRFVRASLPPNPVTSSKSGSALSRAATPVCRTHQRRHSSSKTPRSTDIRGTLPSQGQDQGQQQQATVSRSSRIGRRRAKAVPLPAPTTSDYFEVPSVPSTQHLHPLDVNLSSFFSLHRPISITSPLPLPSSPSAFDRIFEPRQIEDLLSVEQRQQNQFRSILESIGHLPVQDQGLRSNGFPTLLQPSSATHETVTHLDGEPQTPSLEQALSTIPFRAPRAPQPGQDQSNGAQAEIATDIHARPRRRNFRATIKRKSWSTTIIVTETTDHHDRKHYRATYSPITQIPTLPSRYPPGAVVEEPLKTEEDEDSRAIVWRQPFFQRMWLRHQESLRRRREREQIHMPGQGAGYEEMLLISVKRQRKLKMKKHKHKKLLKRTRNLRRKLGQA